MIPDIYSAGDYTGFDTPKISVYYGYEEVDADTEEWCFTVKKNGKEVFRRTNSELLTVANGEGPKDMLIAGLALYLSK